MDLSPNSQPTDSISFGNNSVPLQAKPPFSQGLGNEQNLETQDIGVLNQRKEPLHRSLPSTHDHLSLPNNFYTSEQLPRRNILSPTRNPSVPNSHSNIPNVPGSSTDFVTYVFPDFAAVEYFKKDFDDFEMFYVAEESLVSGLDIYAVEQWLTWRRISTVIAAFTGNIESKATVVRFTTTRQATKLYPPRFQEYLAELTLNHAKQKTVDDKHSCARHGSWYSVSNPAENISLPSSNHRSSSMTATSLHDHAPHDIGFVTSLSSLPLELVLIPITLGDIRTLHRSITININAKRLQCTGRSVDLTIPNLTDSTENKLRQMFCIQNANVPILFAACELVNLLQTCLFYFDLLEPKYCDGFLCDKTLEAIGQWWNLFGLSFMNGRRQDREKVVSARSVAGILSMVLAIRLRLQIVGGCDVGKDIFDFEAFMLSIGLFQKQYNLEKRRKLDLESVERLYAVTSVDIKSEKWSTRRSGSEAVDDASGDIAEKPSADRANLGTSRLKKKHKHYTNEFRKLKSAVKSTVQDRMTGENESAVKSHGSVLYSSRMAKLADGADPRDVETFDLDALVKLFLMGPTLVRLFYGVVSSSLVESADNMYPGPQLSHSTGISYTYWYTRDFFTKEQRQFQFIGLKQKILHRQCYALIAAVGESDPSRYSRGLNRVKNGLYRRGDRSSTRLKVRKRYYELEVDPCSRVNAPGDLTSYDDQTFDKMSGAMCLNASFSSRNHLDLCYRPEKQLEELKRQLNRRNSFPIAIKYDITLNNVDAIHRWGEEKPSDVFRGRSLSDTALANIFGADIDREMPFTTPVLTRLYLKVLQELEEYERETRAFVENRYSAGNITAKQMCLLFNGGVIRLNNVHHRMIAGRKQLMEGEALVALQHDYSEMQGAMDRLVYEARLVEKQVNEVEASYQLMELKLREQCEQKMQQLIEQVTMLYKFHAVFSDSNERADMLIMLGATGQAIPTILKTEYYLNALMLLVYGLVIKILGYMRLDGMNFNTKRIRESWGRVDPNGDTMELVNSIAG